MHNDKGRGTPLEAVGNLDNPAGVVRKPPRPHRQIRLFVAHQRRRFEVHDLGIDQPEETFVKAVADYKPQVLALSGFLSVAFVSLKSTIEQVEAAGLRTPETKIIIGGGQMDDTVRKYTGADAYGDDAMAAVAFAKEAVGVA
jgi:5-methyltetrahydrofolate--homocysteine methyltransferase